MYNSSEIEETGIEWSTEYLVVGRLAEWYSEKKVSGHACLLMSEDLKEKVYRYLSDEQALRMPSFRQFAVKDGDNYEWRAVSEREANKFEIEEDPVFYSKILSDGYDFSGLKLKSLHNSD
ncbi:hypothetical protein CDE51_02290 [Pasteurella multocida]|nr:hypothetical protein CDE51_02290 [Pasteurella multocida]